ncbi:hypothetical protein BGZ72_005384 [Mortierella alpina]|nr:hypothetical protein BGZ72_005384 [Mortierella alpina]
MSVLDLTAGIWHGNATKASVPQRNKGLTAVGNPKDGKIYIRGGYHSANLDTMDVYNPVTDSFESRPIPQSPLLGDLSTGDTGVPTAQWYGAVWRNSTQSILYFGGAVDPFYTTAEIFEYKPASDTWSFMKTTGEQPSPRKDHCMTIDDDHNKLIVFGGQNGDQVFSDIYVLDLSTLDWTKGLSEFEPRTEMACAMFDNGFLIWGGSRDMLQSNPHNSEPVVFNLTTMTWSNGYRMEVETITADPIPTDDKSPSLALILGLVLGMIALATVGFGCCLYRREKRKTNKNRTEQGADGSTKSTVQPPLRSNSPSLERHSHEPGAPRTVHRTRGQVDTVGHTSRQRRESFSDDGSSVEDDDRYLEEEGRFRQSRSNRQPSGRNARNRSRGVRELGHKIELTHMDSADVERPPTPTSYDKEEDVSFKPPSLVRPAPAPGVGQR